jgi:hypothetical protein
MSPTTITNNSPQFIACPPVAIPNLLEANNPDHAPSYPH